MDKEIKLLEIIKKSIDELTCDPANVRKHSEKNIKAIVASLKRFGQQKPIVCDSNMIVRAGNGTLVAAQQLGWEVIDVVVSDLPPSEITAFAIADNRTSELSEWDIEALGLQLQSLEIDLTDIGFDEIDLAALGFENISDENGTDPDEEWEGMPDYQQSEMQPKYKIQVNFLNVEDMVTFSKLIGQKITEKTRSINFPEQEKISENAEVYK